MKQRTRGNGEGTVYQRGGSGPWYISWYGHNGKRLSECTKTTSKAVAQRILAEKLAAVAMRRAGVIDPRQENIAAESARSIDEHIDDFATMMRSRRRSAQHVQQTLAIIRDVCASAKFATPAEIDTDGMNRVLADMTATGQSPRTMQARVVAMKAFTRWLVDGQKLLIDPLRTIKRPSVKTDRRLRRRFLMLDEWRYLYSATLVNGLVEGMSPIDRAALYATAVQTGLRSSELASLTKAELVLLDAKPYVKCSADETKNGEVAKQYINADLAAELRTIVFQKLPSALVFSMPEGKRTASMLRADLKAARKQWLDETRHDAAERARREESDFLAATNHQGERLDFHSLRHTCGAWLAIAGIHPNTIKTVMRHSSITLTMDTYGHLLPDAHADAVASMPGMVGQSLAATGTECSSTDSSSNNSSVHVPASLCEEMRDSRDLGAEESGIQQIKSLVRYRYDHDPTSDSGDDCGNAIISDAPTTAVQIAAGTKRFSATETLRLHIAAHTQGDVE